MVIVSSRLMIVFILIMIIGLRLFGDIGVMVGVIMDLGLVVVVCRLLMLFCRLVSWLVYSCIWVVVFGVGLLEVVFVEILVRLLLMVLVCWFRILSWCLMVLLVSCLWNVRNVLV